MKKETIKEIFTHTVFVNERFRDGVLDVAIENNDMSGVKLALWLGANPSGFTNPSGELCDPYPPIARAIANGISNKDLSIAEFLLESGADPNGNGGSYDPLKTTITKNSIDAFELLIKYGADPNGRFGKGEPLAAAFGCSGYQSYFLDRLFELGAEECPVHEVQIGVQRANESNAKRGVPYHYTLERIESDGYAGILKKVDGYAQDTHPSAETLEANLG